MPPILAKLLFNKYTLILMIVLSLGLYINNITTKNSELVLRVQQLVIYNDEYNKALEEIKEEKRLILSIQEKDCKGRIEIVKESKDVIDVIEKVKVKTQELETVNEKNILGSKLPDDIIDSLRVHTNK